MNSLHGLLDCEIGGLPCHVITTEYRTRVHCIHMCHLLCNALVHVIHSGVSGQCSHTTHVCKKGGNNCSDMNMHSPYVNRALHATILLQHITGYHFTTAHYRHKFKDCL